MKQCTCQTQSYKPTYIPQNDQYSKYTQEKIKGAEEESSLAVTLSVFAFAISILAITLIVIL